MHSEHFVNLSPATPLRLHVATRADHGTTCVAVTGELDMSTAAELRAAVAAVLASGSVDVEIDLAGVPFADSAGVRALMMCRDAAEQAGARLRLSHPSPDVHRVLELTGAMSYGRGGGVPPPRGVNPTVVDARAIRQAAQKARERAQHMRRDDEARRVRIRATRGH